MSNKPKSLYSGELKKPIGPITTNGDWVILPKDLYERYIISKWSEKLDLLLAHYKIGLGEQERWRKLALCLALDHVPGMGVIDKPGKRKGAPKKWGAARAKEFVQLIEKIEHERNKGINDAIRIALKRKQLEGNFPRLERLYYEIKKRSSLRYELTAGPYPNVQKLMVIDVPATGSGGRVSKKPIKEPIFRFMDFGRDVTSTNKRLSQLFSLRIIRDDFFRSRITRISGRSPR